MRWDYGCFQTWAAFSSCCNSSQHPSLLGSRMG
ncbi:hypothetical protein CSA_023967, partial [Cucumis sativus]